MARFKEMRVSNLKCTIYIRQEINEDHMLFLASLIDAGTELPPPKVTEKGRCRFCEAPVFWIYGATRGMICNPGVLTVITDEGLVVKGRESHFSTRSEANGPCPEGTLEP